MDTKRRGRGPETGSVARQRDPNDARRRLLDAGAAVFSEAGYAGARVDVIAGRAGLNKRMLYHYFGDKAGLYRAVLEDRLGVLGSGDSQPDDHRDLEPLAGFVGRLDATLARLLLWDLLHPANETAPSPGVGVESGLPVTGALVRALGRLPAGASPAWLAPMLLAYLVVSRAHGGSQRDDDADVLLPRVREMIAALGQAPVEKPTKPRIRLKAASAS